MKMSQDSMVVALPLVEVNQNKIGLGKRVSKKPQNSDFIYYSKTRDFFKSATKQNTKRKKSKPANNKKSAKRVKLEEKQRSTTEESIKHMKMNNMKSELMELSTYTNGRRSSNKDLSPFPLSLSSSNSGDSPDQQRYGHNSSDSSLRNSSTILKLKQKYEKRVKNKEISIKIKEKFPHFDHLEWVSELSYQHKHSKKGEINETREQNFAKQGFSSGESRLCQLQDIREHSINKLRSQLCQYCFSTLLNIDSYNIISNNIKQRTLTIGLSSNKCNNCDKPK